MHAWDFALLVLGQTLNHGEDSSKKERSVPKEVQEVRGKKTPEEQQHHSVFEVHTAVLRKAEICPAHRFWSWSGLGSIRTLWKTGIQPGWYTSLTHTLMAEICAWCIWSHTYSGMNISQCWIGTTFIFNIIHSSIILLWLQLDHLMLTKLNIHELSVHFSLQKTRNFTTVFFWRSKNDVV